MKDLMKFENKQVRSHWDAEEEKWYFFYCGCHCCADGQPQSTQILECVKNKTKKRRKRVGYKL